MDPKTLDDKVVVPLFQIFPSRILSILVLPGEKYNALHDYIFSLSSKLEIRIVSLLNMETKVSTYDCNEELPHGMKPKLKSVIFSGMLGLQICILFENLFYMIVDINEGKVQSFTLSELTGIK